MRTMLKPAVFTEGKRRAIITYAIGSRRFSKYQRCILKSLKDYNAGILTLLLGDYFPGLIFIPERNADNLAILNYIKEKKGKWTLDINAMSKSKEKIFACLFPKDISSWNENEARKRFGRADIIKFFVDVENEKFLREFSKLKDAASADVDKDAVPGDFFNALDESKKQTGEHNRLKPAWEEWDFSGVVLHKLRHDPPSIYEAFDYYGHRNYSQLRFGLFKLAEKKRQTPDSYNTAELFKAGNELLGKIVSEEFPETAKYGMDRQVLFFELLQRTLESVPNGTSIYSPTEPDTFIRQLKSGASGFHKANPDIDYRGVFSSSERKTINNHIQKIKQYIDDGESYSELRGLELDGTYREKINLLHRLIMRPDIREHYTEREIAIIHALFLKQFSAGSLDGQIFRGEDDAPISAYDITPDRTYMRPEEYVITISFFRDVFEQEFDEAHLALFLESLPNHFEQYPFETDSEGKLIMSKYSKKMLFSTFCSIAGIAADSELWGPFLTSIQQVIDNINRS